jgi:hypothetical protein
MRFHLIAATIAATIAGAGCKSDPPHINDGFLRSQLPTSLNLRRNSILQ